MQTIDVKLLTDICSSVLSVLQTPFTHLFSLHVTWSQTWRPSRRGARSLHTDGLQCGESVRENTALLTPTLQCLEDWTLSSQDG